MSKNDDDSDFFNVVMLGTFSTSLPKGHTVNVFLRLNFDNLVDTYSYEPSKTERVFNEALSNIGNYII